VRIDYRNGVVVDRRKYKNENMNGECWSERQHDSEYFERPLTVSEKTKQIAGRSRTGGFAFLQGRRKPHKPRVYGKKRHCPLKKRKEGESFSTKVAICRAWETRTSH